MIDNEGAIAALIAENKALRQRMAELDQECQTMQRILQNAPVFIYLYDLIEQRTVFGNSGLAAMLGYTDITELQQMGDEVVARLMHSDDMERFPTHIARFGTLSDNVVIEFEYRMQHTDGAWRWCKSHDRVFNRTTDGAPRQILGVVQDITEQKQSQDAMHLAQLALDHAGDAIFWTNSSGQFIYGNHAACASLGYTSDELLALQINDVDRTISSEQWQENMRLLQQHRSTTFETQHWHKDDSTFPVEVSASYITVGETAYIYGFARDISERKQRERDLKLFKTLVENAPDAIAVGDMHAHILYANPAYKTITGYGEALIGMDVLSLVVEENHAMIAEAMHTLAKKGAATIFTTYRRQDGSTFPVEITGFQIEDDEGETQLIAFVRDISERKRAEQERTILQQQIIDAQSAAIRELSTPLIPISNTAMIMPLIGTIDSTRAQQVLETLLEGVAQHRATIAILDITGVQVVDTQVAQAFIQAAQAVKLLGAQVMLTGIQPQIAQTLVYLGVDLSGIQTRGSLQAGIAYALADSRKQVQATPRQ